MSIETPREVAQDISSTLRELAETGAPDEQRLGAVLAATAALADLVADLYDRRDGAPPV